MSWRLKLACMIAGEEPNWRARAVKAEREVETLRGVVLEYSGTFDICWKADMRAINRWRAAHPGNDLVWPDRTDMVVWLMDELESAKADADIGKTIKRAAASSRADPVSKPRVRRPAGRAK